MREIFLSPFRINLLRGFAATSGFFSICGSFLIIQRILRRARVSSSPYERLLLGLSISDILLSAEYVVFPLAFWPFLEPSAACSAEGFLRIFGYASPLYNSSLSFYFSAVIIHSISETRMAKVFEPFMHIGSVLFPFVVAVIGVSLNYMNPKKNNVGCGVNTYPNNCVGDECTRGGPRTKQYTLFGAVLPMAFTLITLIVNNTRIFLYVRRLERRSRRFNFPVADRALALHSTELVLTSERNNEGGDLVLTKRVATQSILYVLAYMICFFPATLLYITALADKTGTEQGRYYALQALDLALYPLQGLFNVMVYTRPTFLSWRRNTDLSFISCIWKVLFDVSAEAPTVSTRRIVPKRRNAAVATKQQVPKSHPKQTSALSSGDVTHSTAQEEGKSDC